MSLSSAQTFLESFGIHANLFRFLFIGGLIFTRFFILFLFVPYLGVKPVPGRARVALSFACTLLFYGPVSAAAPEILPSGAGLVVGLFFKELIFAILFGFAAGAVFYGMQAAGGMVDNQRQLANAQIFNPGIGSQSSLFGVFYYQLAIVVFIMVGGVNHFFMALGRSFEAVPVWGFPQIQPGWGAILEVFYTLTAQVLIIALQLGAPVLVAIFIADLILGMTNRMAPMVNVFEMGFNIKGFLGVLMVYLSLEMILGQMKYWFMDYLRHLQEIVNLFMGV